MLQGSTLTRIFGRCQRVGLPMVHLGIRGFRAVLLHPSLNR